MVVDAILPLFILTMLGYACVYFKLITAVQIQAMSTFVIKVALPIFLIYALSSKSFDELWHPSYVLAYGLGSIIIFALAYFCYWHYFRMNLTHTAVMSMGASMSNTGFIGTAILTMLIGQHAAVYVSLTLIIENVLILTLVLTLAELGQQKGEFKKVLKNTLKNVIKNPVIVAIMIGLILTGFNITLPQQMTYAFELLGKTAAPIALFVIGGSLVGIGLAGLNLSSLILVSMKVILMPLVIYALLSVLPNVSREMLHAGTLIAALPMPIAFGIFGQAYGLNERALTPLMLSTIFGFIGVSVLIYCWY